MSSTTIFCVFVLLTVSVKIETSPKGKAVQHDDGSPAAKQSDEEVPGASAEDRAVAGSEADDLEARTPSLAHDSPANNTDLEAAKDANADATAVASENLNAYSAFSTGQKWFIVVMASVASFFSPLSGQIYFPVLPILTENYHLSQSLINVSVTTYLVFQGLAPSFMASFSDASGRRLGYILAFATYAVANIGLALQDSYAALLVLLCVQSAGSSGTFISRSERI